MLNPQIFKSCCESLNFTPNIDCFANRLNTQLEQYASYKQDPYAKFINAFSFNWDSYNCYIFPPFSLIGRTLQKVRVDQATAMIVAPYWPTQFWYSTFREMLQEDPIFIQPHPQNLQLPQTPLEVHALAKKLTLMVGIVCAKNI